MDGDRKSEIEVPDEIHSFDELANGPNPRIVVAVGADEEAEVPRGGCEADLTPFRGNFEERLSASIFAETPHWDDE